MNFDNLPEQKPDLILWLSKEISQDTRSFKVNWVVGVYCDNKGSPNSRLPSVEIAMIRNPWSPNYAPIAGDPKFLQRAWKLLFGDELFHTISDKTAQIQTIGGTWALYSAASLLHTIHPDSIVHISNPTWPNHRGIFKQAWFKDIQTYPYYNSATKTIDTGAMKESLKSLPADTIVVLHACCHNPTGQDLPSKDWDEIVEIIKGKKLMPVIDIAYQWFGDWIEEDAIVVRKFAQAGIHVLIAQSFSKMFHIYNSRTGVLHFICDNPDEKIKVQGNLESISRRIISNPPAEWARIITTILWDPELKNQWEKELHEMSQRIQSMRQQLVSWLWAEFDHLKWQTWMFSYTGLTAEEVQELKVKYAIYMLLSWRLSIPGLNEKNIGYVIDAILTTLETTRKHA